MLDLDSPRWLELKVHIPDELPPIVECIQSWKKSLNTESELERFQDFQNQFLHQDTILSSAFAAVPHIVGNLGKVTPQNQVIYLSTIALVEMARSTQAEHEAAIEEIKKSPSISDELREHFLSVTIDRTAPPPADLEADYKAAIQKAKKVAIELLDKPLESESVKMLMGAMVGLYKRTEQDLAKFLIYPEEDPV